MNRNLEKARAARSPQSRGVNQFTKAKKEGRSIVVSDETKAKLAESARGNLHSEETKSLLSEKRKKWLAENPDEHPWKTNTKFKSVPCEVLKEKLRDRGLQFEEEHSPVEGRAFSVDIAFPAKKLGIEVNGEQHYRRDGTLGDYYQERHDLIEREGWTLLEVHYARAYDDNIVDEIITRLYRP